MFYSRLCDQAIGCLSYGNAPFSTCAIGLGSADVLFWGRCVQDRQMKQVGSGCFKFPVALKVLKGFCQDI
jgi:hypothetical protein